MNNNTQNIREELKKLINEVMNLDIDKIDNNKNLSEIDAWDSFNNLMLISKAEDYFKIKFGLADIEDVNTINKIIDIVKKKVTAKN